jgi:hypothetical protein
VWCILFFSGSEVLWGLEDFLERVCFMREAYHDFLQTKQVQLVSHCIFIIALLRAFHSAALNEFIP